MPRSFELRIAKLEFAKLYREMGIGPPPDCIEPEVCEAQGACQWLGCSHRTAAAALALAAVRQRAATDAVNAVLSEK